MMLKKQQSYGAPTIGYSNQRVSILIRAHFKEAVKEREREREREQTFRLDYLAKVIFILRHHMSTNVIHEGR